MLYRALAAVSPSPVIALNHAVAMAMSDGLETGLALIDELGKTGELSDYYLYHAARADLLRRLGRNNDAAVAYRDAIDLATNDIEINYLKRRLAQVGGDECDVAPPSSHSRAG